MMLFVEQNFLQQLTRTIIVLLLGDPNAIVQPLHRCVLQVEVVFKLLLQRRPDIASAERRMAAANAQIGIAQSAFFPDLTLSGSVGLESSTLSQLLAGPSLLWSLGPQLAETVFDGGLRRSKVEGEF